MALAVFLPDSTKRKRLRFLHESKTRGKIARGLGIAKEMRRLEQGGEEGLDG